MLAAEHHTLGRLLGLEDVLEQVGGRAIDRLQHAGRAWSDVRVRVDLTVRVGQGDADRLTTVLEREDLLDAGQRRQRRRTVGPGLDDGAGAGDGLRAEGSRVLGAEADDLAASDRGACAAEAEGCEIVESAGRVGCHGCGAHCFREGGPERGRAVLEHRDVVARGHFRRIARSLRRERVGVGAGHHHAVLPVRGDGDPVAGEHVEAHRRGVRAGVENAGVDGSIGSERGAGVVVVDEVAAVGEGGGASDDAGAEGVGAQLRKFGRVHV